MTLALFDDAPEPVRKKARTASPNLLPAPASAQMQTLARVVPAQLRLGTSSWTFPSWAGLVWD